MTTPDLARTILKVAALSVIVAWMTWGTTFLALYLILLATRSVPGPEMWDELGWWYFPATLLGLWTTVALLASIGLTGRNGLFVKLICGFLALVIGLPLFSSFAFSEQGQLKFACGAAIGIGIALLLITIWIFVAAGRRMLIGWPTVSIAVGMGTALFALVTLEWMQHTAAPITNFVLLIGLVSLAVAPLAAAPLALAWNRHR